MYRQITYEYHENFQKRGKEVYSMQLTDKLLSITFPTLLLPYLMKKTLLALCLVAVLSTPFVAHMQSNQDLDGFLNGLFAGM